MFNLISDIIDQNSPLYYMYQRRLGDYITNQQRNFNYSSFDPKQNTLVSRSLRSFSESTFSPLFDLVSNEIYFDLMSGYKNNNLMFRGRQDLAEIINLTYTKYDSYIRAKIANFFKDLSKLQKSLRKEKWKIKKIKRVTKPQKPIKIPLDVRFAIIKRADGKCEECKSSIFESPIEVFQIRFDEGIDFIAYCENCRNLNRNRIIDEPEEEEIEKNERI